MNQIARRNYDSLMEMAGGESRALQHHGGHSAAHGMEHVPAHHGGHPGHTVHVDAHGAHPGEMGHHGGHVREVHHHYGPPPPPHGREIPLPPAPEEYEQVRRHRKHLKRSEPHEHRAERLFPIGFYAEGILPNDEEDIEVKPQVTFRGERLAIPQSLARYFDILDVKVGKDSQLAATGTMPGESFSALAVGVRMELDEAEPGIVITIRVRNTDTVPHDFKAVMYGTVIEDE